MTVTPPRRDQFGRWMKGPSPNPRGRPTRQTEAEYLNVSMGVVTIEKWAEVMEIALTDALDTSLSAHVRARAREWLGKIVIGDSASVHQLLYKEERTFEIIVKFGDEPKALPDVIEGVVIENANPDQD